LLPPPPLAAAAGLYPIFGRDTLFGVNHPRSPLTQLMAVLEDRKRNPPPRSYTTSLLAGGTPKIGKKILEEANEVVAAADEPGEEGRRHLIYEAGDLIYHLFVLLAHRDVRLDEVEQELARRFGVSGLDEKESRGQNAASSGE
jgi:phosphoribosyl-ATP pyrophosphohydrolase